MISKSQLVDQRADLLRQADQLFEQLARCRGAIEMLDYLLALPDEEAQDDGTDTSER